MLKSYRDYKGHNHIQVNKQDKRDGNIYTFDIETTSYIKYRGQILPAVEYINIPEINKDEVEFGCNMYCWQLSINDQVYGGRSFCELDQFLKTIDAEVRQTKILFIQNASFEFSYLESVFQFNEILSREPHKIMKAMFKYYNFEIRCTYYMSNLSLASIAKNFNLPVKKLVGDLDYNKLRHIYTPLTAEEDAYRENDCLIIYYYIKELLKEYEYVHKIPLTNTGQVRREFKSIVNASSSMRYKVARAVNTDPHIYNFLIDTFMGGYVHANFLNSSIIIKDVISWDFTSSYPYCLLVYPYPATKFKQCYIKSIDDMMSGFAYLLKVKISKMKSNFYNNYLSKSKCYEIEGGVYDNGRIIAADSLITYLTDIDAEIVREAYSGDIEILESYNSQYKRLPWEYVNFILNKYEAKTKFKNNPGHEEEYMKEKNRYNSLYGMSVTNEIRNEVEFNNGVWEEIPLTNDEIIEKLEGQEKRPFLSFAYGVWCTAYARRNIFSCIMKLDKYVIYSDTDSIKLKSGYDKSVIDDYNANVVKLVQETADFWNTPLDRFQPEDVEGNKHMIGLFDLDGEYSEFITHGSKKYAYRDKKDGQLHITVAGVPKKGVECLNDDINNFQDGLLFSYKATGKQSIEYCSNQLPIEMTDYTGKTYRVTDKSGACIYPVNYTLSRALDYCELLTDASSERARYNENVK